MIHGPGDIEGHLGNDGQYYMVDFGRTFPPEAPLPVVYFLSLSLFLSFSLLNIRGDPVFFRGGMRAIVLIFFFFFFFFFFLGRTRGSTKDGFLLSPSS